MSGVNNPLPVKKNWFASHKIYTIFFVLVILILFIPKTPPLADGEIGPEKRIKTTTQKTTITMEEFTAVQNGMTYQQVIDIVGGPGELIAESQFGDMKSTMYQFHGDKFTSNANITIQNGKVTVKAQFGL